MLLVTIAVLLVSCQQHCSAAAEHVQTMHGLNHMVLANTSPAYALFSQELYHA
jgi:hypothetical protein